MKQLNQHNYNAIDATIIADSKNEHGNRITSFIVTMPRIVLAEFNTHRALTRNSASSRAIPFNKMVEKVQNTPFIPIKWMKDHSGMQGNEYLDNKTGSIDEVKGLWLKARDSAIENAVELRGDGEEMLTKQLCNRLIEPFMYHTAITTATEWENFYALRAHDAAEIHIAKLADMMLEQANLSEPKLLKAGEWHIPFGDNMDITKITKLDIQLTDQGIIDAKIKIATARCARVSYLNFEGKDDYEADIKLHDRLLSMGHWSPFEHCAQAMSQEQYHVYNGAHHMNTKGNGWLGNFKGFIQYRKTFEGENKRDSRLIKK